MTTTDWRELCAELANDLQEARDAVADWAAYASEYFQQKHDLQGELDRINCRLARARAALAQPEPALAAPPAERPPAMTISALLHPGYEPGDGSADGAQLVGMQWWVPIMGCDSLQSVVDNARAVLSRWGRPAPAPAGEVAEVIADLRECADSCTLSSKRYWAEPMRRAAALLERQAAPVPVPVSERLPGPEDCDAEGRCWVYELHEACPECPSWELRRAKYASAIYGAVCWLPAHALPLPSGEVEG